MPGLTEVQWGLAVFLAGILVWITITDLRGLRIPDVTNLLLAMGGVGAHWLEGDGGLFASILSAVCVIILLAGVRFVYEMYRGYPGLGLGDVKMAGAAAIWILPLNLPLMMLVACISCLSFVFGRQMLGQNVRFDTRIAFGPFIGLGLMAVWLAERW